MLKRRSTTAPVNDQVGCQIDQIPKPNFHNNLNVTYYVKNHTLLPNSYQIGSTVGFVCKKGYFVRKQESHHLFHLNTTCLPSGNWSKVADCNNDEHFIV